LVKKLLPRRPSTKKSVVRKPPTKKPLPHLSPTKKPVVFKPPAKKPLPRRPPAKKPVVLKPPAKKPLFRRPLAKKPVTLKPPAKKPPPVKRKTASKKPRLRKPAFKKPLPSKRKPAPKKPLPSKRKPALKKLLPSKRKPAFKKPLPSKRKPAPKKRLPSRRKPTLKKPLPSKRKPTLKKPLPSKRKPTLKKPLPSKRKPAAKKPASKRKIRRQYPTFIEQANAAELLALQKLAKMQDTIAIIEPEIDAGLKSMINADGTMDVELRLRNLPELWRTYDGQPSLGSALSEAVRVMGAFPRQPAMGGAFWVSFGVRFGPKNEAEVEMMAKFYKRFRGLFQVGAYHTTASALPAILNNAASIRSLVENIWEKRDLPPAQVLVRIVWTPDGQRPGRFQGEGGSAK